MYIKLNGPKKDEFKDLFLDKVRDTWLDPVTGRLISTGERPVNSLFSKLSANIYAAHDSNGHKS